MNGKAFLNQYFDKIYVLTLRRATDRHIQVAQDLAGINFEFFYGEDKQAFTIEEAIKSKVYCPQRTKKENRFYPQLSHGEVACAWSHLNIYKDMVRNGYQRVLIFEDDVVTINDNLEKIADSLRQAPQSWDVIYLGYDKYGRKPRKTIKHLFYKAIGALRITPWTYKMFCNYYPKHHSEYFLKAGYHNGAYAYAVSLEGAQKMISYQTPIAFSSDTMIAYATMKELINAYLLINKAFNENGISYIWREYEQLSA